MYVYDPSEDRVGIRPNRVVAACEESSRDGVAVLRRESNLCDIPFSQEPSEAPSLGQSSSNRKTTVERIALRLLDGMSTARVFIRQEGLDRWRACIDRPKDDPVAPGQRESADFRSSRRGVASQVKSLAERPKCP